MVTKSENQYKVFLLIHFHFLPYHNMVHEMFNESFTDKLFNKEKINQLLEEHYSNKKNNGRKIYNIYIFLIWYKKYFVEN